MISDLNNPPSSSVDPDSPHSHPFTPPNPYASPQGLHAAQAANIPVRNHGQGLMQLGLPVSPLSGADPEEDEDDSSESSDEDPQSQVHSPPVVPPPAQNVRQQPRPQGAWQKKVTFEDGAFLQPYEDERDGFYQQLHLRSMVHACNLCGALHWLAECLTSSSQVNPKFGRCCLHGKVVLPHLTRPPQTLELLLGSCQDFLNNPFQLSQVQHERSKHFHQYIRSYNAAFAFVSLGYKPDECVSGQGGPPVFKIRGTLSHCHSTLLPEVC